MDIKIPSSLKHLNRSSSDVNVIVGENGQGKSRALSELADYYWRSGMAVVAVASSIYDKFVYHSDDKYSLLRARSWKSKPDRILKSALASLTSSKLETLPRISRSLKYVGYDAVIGLEIKGFDPTPLFDPDDEPEESLVRAVEDIARHFDSRIQDDKKNMIWIDTNVRGISELKGSELLDILPLEKELHRRGVIKKINVYLRKGAIELPILSASSGELALIILIVFLAIRINDNTAIVIDEPENSLHPQWQKEYVTTLLDIFVYYEPRFVLATHSPIVVSGAVASSQHVSVFSAINGTLALVPESDLSIEDMLLDIFGVVTPKNHSLSERIVEILNELAEEERTLDAVTLELARLRASVYDRRQTELLNEVEGLAREISRNE